MKKNKLIVTILATALSLTLCITAFAEEPPMGDGTMPQMPEMTEEMLAELEALAEAAGMTLEEYMATMEPEMGQGMQPNMEGEMGGQPQVTQSLATATTSAVYVDGTNTAFEAYNIDGNNYFKLRDLAAVASGSEKEFDVSWDGDLNAINLVSGSSYTAIGGELEAGDGTDKAYTATTATIYIDGVETAFEAYNINGNNFFKLRDVCSAFDIGVTWNSETSSIDVDTTISYTE